MKQARQITLRVSDDLYAELKAKGGERGLGKAIREAVQRGLNAPECYCNACGAHSDHWAQTPTDVRHEPMVRL